MIGQAIDTLSARLILTVVRRCPVNALRLWSAIGFLSLAYSVASAAAPRFTLQSFVSPLEANAPSHATDVNDAGFVIVNFYNPVYSDGFYSYTAKDGQYYENGTSYAQKINNLNQVIGYGGTASSSFGGFFDGTQGIRLEELPGGQYWNRPNALNDAGQIYGYSLADSNSRGGWQRAVGWTSDGKIFELGIPAAGTWGNIAQAANNLNQVVGYRDGRNDSPDVATRAWLWQNGSAELLPNLPGALRPVSYAYSINERSQIAGAYFDFPPSGTIGGAAIWQNGQLKILPVPTGTQESTAYDINDAGYVVGLAYRNVEPVYNAALWDLDGNAYLLESLVNNLQGWKLDRALAINNRNQIAAIAVDSKGIQRGVLLTPVVPEPSSTVFLLIAFVFCVRIRRRG